MTDDQLAKELHELKRRRETPLPLIEMFDALLSLAPRTERKTEAQAIRRDHGYGLETVGTQGHLTATGGWRGRQRTHLPVFQGKQGRNRKRADLRAANILAAKHSRPSAGRSQDALGASGLCTLKWGSRDVNMVVTRTERR
jgi:hypothetical protein